LGFANCADELIAPHATMLVRSITKKNSLAMADETAIGSPTFAL
jgi:hypothetical protein